MDGLSGNNRFINILLFVPSFSYAPRCRRAFGRKQCHTPMSDLGQQGLFDITGFITAARPVPAKLLTRLVQQSALADEAAHHPVERG